MARWLGIVRIPKTEERGRAQLVAEHLHGERLVEVALCPVGGHQVWCAIVRLDDARDRRTAEAQGREIHGGWLVAVRSVASLEAQRIDDQVAKRRRQFTGDEDGA